MFPGPTSYGHSISLEVSGGFFGGQKHFLVPSCVRPFPAPRVVSGMCGVPSISLETGPPKPTKTSLRLWASWEREGM